MTQFQPTAPSRQLYAVPNTDLRSVQSQNATVSIKPRAVQRVRMHRLGADVDVAPFVFVRSKRSDEPFTAFPRWDVASGRHSDRLGGRAGPHPPDRPRGGVSDGEVGEEPEVWWAQSARGEPRYDVLLDALAPTDAARQALLRRYFDPRPPVGPINPTDGHRALAWLCASGLVRVIMTTNFDRLLERALEEAGASPQVISGASGVEGMTPLVHSRSTVIKLHGDWATLGMRNTPEELRAYPAELRRLLDSVLDEYGLVVIGWSGEYDVALADAIAACPSRRYPTYWATFRGALTEAAKRLIAQRPTAVIDTTGADEFLVDLAQRSQNLAARAARRVRPSRLRVHRHMPQHGSPPQACGRELPAFIAS